MLTNHFDYEEHLAKEESRRAIESMVAPSVEDAAEVVRTETDRVKW